MKKLLMISMAFFIGALLFAGGKKDDSTRNQNKIPPPEAKPAQVIPAPTPAPAAPVQTVPARPVPLPEPAPPPNPFYTGSGGKDMSLAILAPKGTGLAENQNYLPALVQGEFVSNFSGYSAISILDRENLDKLFAETHSGYYEDDAEGVIRLGHMTNTDYIMTGTVTKTSSGYTLQMQIASSIDGMTKASYSGTCTIAELDNFTGIRRASVELLEKMGVELTGRAKTELAGAATEQAINAQTTLAKGIEALRQGTVVEALSYFIQSSNTDPQLVEAASRVNILSANISSGNIGADTRNDIQWRKQWIERLAETETFYANYTKVQPYYLTYSTDITQGAINYEKETVVLSFPMALLPEAVWVSTINEIICTVKIGLNATGRAETWGIDWPEKSINAATAITQRQKELAVTADIINAEGKIIGRQTVSLPYGWYSVGGIMAPLCQF